ncbi:histone H1-III-like [Cloeon dipterum]|uniref:histone H1-III-like n=1 Tax=Cloeon dipterum TaxID=197152 RepID=UPI00321F7BFF
MADDIADDPVPKSPVKAKDPLAKKAAAASTHPPTAQMVNDAIKSMKERGGSSLRAIKKFIASKYEVDAKKLAPFIRKYLKSAVNKGDLVQTKGKGASGSFKLNPAVNEKAKVVKSKKQPASERVKLKTAGGKPKKAAATKEKKSMTTKVMLKKGAKSSTKEKKVMANKPSKSPKEKKQLTKKKAPAKKTPAMKTFLKKAAAKKA